MNLVAPEVDVKPVTLKAVVVVLPEPLNDILRTPAPS
jgi:hypothetical protein